MIAGLRCGVVGVVKVPCPIREVKWVGAHADIPVGAGSWITDRYGAVNYVFIKILGLLQGFVQGVE